MTDRYMWTALCTLHLSTRSGSIVSFTLWQIYLRGQESVPQAVLTLYKKEASLLFDGSRTLIPRFCSPQPNRFTDSAIPAPYGYLIRAYVYINITSL
jgi:hypothetical protein